MTIIELTTQIDAPVETCFQLALSIDLELQAAKTYSIRAVSGVTSGIIGPGQRVGWKTTQFGVTVSHLSEITGYQKPLFFQDRMINGIFQSFEHDHVFQPLSPCKTEMRDLLRFSMPKWLLGVIAERLIVRARLTQLLLLRNKLIQQTAHTINP